MPGRRVSFSTGETTSHVNVQLFWKQTQDGMPRWIQRESSTTNSAGEFRFADLAPGSYRVATEESLDNDPAARLSRSQLYGFPPVYFPNSPDFTTAATIEVAAGQTVQADISLVHQPYFSVRIPVAGEMAGGLNITVSLQGHRGPGYSLGYNMQEHRIEGLLPNGTYVVDAVSFGENSSSGTTTLRVAGGPAVGPALTMVPNNGVVLNIKEEFTDPEPWNGSSSWSINGRMVPVHGPRVYLNANLEPADDFVQGHMGTIRPPLGPNDDSLVLTSVPPGRYWLRLYSGRGYVASATMGAIDVLRQPINITAGSAASVDVTLRDDYASIEGTVSRLQSKMDDPESQLVWFYFVPMPDSSGQFSQMGTQGGQQFHSGPLVPGTYRVLAFSHAQPNLPYRDPQAMRAYESKGQLIHLAPGEKASLQVQSIAEE